MAEVYAALIEQYARHPAENNTYTLDSTEDDRPWVRSMTPQGWGAWIRRDGGGRRLARPVDECRRAPCNAEGAEYVSHVYASR